jgi:DNA-binding transcriptional regulator PaaX
MRLKLGAQYLKYKETVLLWHPVLNPTEYRTAEYNTTEYRTTEYNTTEYRTTEYNTTKYRTTEYKTTENNTTFRLKDVKELVYWGFGRITKEVWAKAEDHVSKIEKEYGKENCSIRNDEQGFLELRDRVGWQFYQF